MACEGGSRAGRNFLFSDLNLFGLVLTFVWMTSFDISGDANDGQSVDAYKAEEQREEAIYLERDKYLSEPTEASRPQDS